MARIRLYCYPLARCFSTNSAVIFFTLSIRGIRVENRSSVRKLKPKFHLARLDSTRHVRLCRASRASRDERVERDECVEECFSNMADNEEAVVLACTSFIVCALCAHVNKKRKKDNTQCG